MATNICCFCTSDASANVNTIKHMLAGLSEFQEGKNSYTLHLNMAQECMKIFQNHKLMDISSVEQVSYAHTNTKDFCFLQDNSVWRPV